MPPQTSIKIKIYSPLELDIKSIIKNADRVKKNAGNPGRKNKPTLIDMVCCFDIETTYLDDIEQSFMYIWQFQLGPYTIVGRTWDEFKEFCFVVKIDNINCFYFFLFTKFLD